MTRPKYPLGPDGLRMSRLDRMTPEILRLYASSVSIVSIAAELRMDTENVRKVLRRNNVKIRSSGEQVSMSLMGGRSLDDAAKFEARRMYLVDHISIEMISKKIGLSYPCIRAYLFSLPEVAALGPKPLNVLRKKKREERASAIAEARRDMVVTRPRRSSTVIDRGRSDELITRLRRFYPNVFNGVVKGRSKDLWFCGGDWRTWAELEEMASRLDTLKL